MTPKEVGQMFDQIIQSLPPEDNDFSMVIFGKTNGGRVFSRPPSWNDKPTMWVVKQIENMLCYTIPDYADDDEITIINTIKMAVVRAAIFYVSEDREAMRQIVETFQKILEED